MSRPLAASDPARKLEICSTKGESGSDGTRTRDLRRDRPRRFVHVLVRADDKPLKLDVFRGSPTVAATDHRAGDSDVCATIRPLARSTCSDLSRTKPREMCLVGDDPCRRCSCVRLTGQLRQRALIAPSGLWSLETNGHGPAVEFRLRPLASRSDHVTHTDEPPPPTAAERPAPYIGGPPRRSAVRMSPPRDRLGRIAVESGPEALAVPGAT